jgi:hypothetical protein
MYMLSAVHLRSASSGVPRMNRHGLRHASHPLWLPHGQHPATPIYPPKPHLGSTLSRWSAGGASRATLP